MKKFLVVALAVFALVGCGSDGSPSTTEEPVEEALDLSTIGSVYCLMDGYGGYMFVDVLIKKEGVDKDNIRFMHFEQGAGIDGSPDAVGRLIRPLIDETGANYEVIADITIGYNKTDSSITHIADMIYFENGAQRVYRGSCIQHVVDCDTCPEVEQ